MEIAINFWKTKMFGAFFLNSKFIYFFYGVCDFIGIYSIHGINSNLS